MEEKTISKQTLKDKMPPLGATLGGGTKISISICIITAVAVILFCISVLRIYLSITVVP